MVLYYVQGGEDMAKYKTVKQEKIIDEKIKSMTKHLNRALIANIKDSLSFYIVALIFVGVYLAGEKPFIQVLSLIIVIGALILAPIYIADVIYLQINVRKQLKAVNENGKVPSREIQFIKTRTKGYFPFWISRYEEYLKILYAENENGKRVKYFFIIEDIEDFCPEKPSKCRINIYPETNIIKEFIDW